MEHCEKEAEWGALKVTLESMTAWMNRIENGICKHIDEGERKGGYRDRLRDLEEQRNTLKKEISTIKKGYWKACIVSGLIGGLLGNLTPEAFNVIFKFIIKALANG